LCDAWAPRVRTGPALAPQCAMAPSPRPPIQVTAHIDDPIALLLACHEKVRRFVTLLGRLQAHMQMRGNDASAREAAQSVLRYFDVAAPLHHADEELDLVPALLTLPSPELHRHATEIMAEHEALNGQWAAIRVLLQAIVAGADWPEASAADSPDTAAFAQHYLAHAEAEERLLYPYAAQLSTTQRQAMAEAMSARRRV